MRVGIGHPGDRDRVHGYVLSDFAKVDQDWLGPLIDACVDAFPFLAEGQPDRFMNRVSVLTQPPKPEKAKDASGPTSEQRAERRPDPPQA